MAKLSRAQRRALHKLARLGLVHDLAGTHVIAPGSPFSRRYVRRATMQALLRKGLVREQTGNNAEKNYQGVKKHLGIDHTNFTFYLLAESFPESHQQ